MSAQRQNAKRHNRFAQRSLSAKEEAVETCDAPIQAADLSFGHWVASTEDDEDTASSNSASSKAARCASPTAEESLMCDEEIGECTQPPSKRQRKSCGFNSNNSTAEPSTGLGKDLSWLLNNSMQAADAWFQVCLPHHMMPNTVHPIQLRMHA